MSLLLYILHIFHRLYRNFLGIILSGLLGMFLTEEDWCTVFFFVENPCEERGKATY